MCCVASWVDVLRCKLSEWCVHVYAGTTTVPCSWGESTQPVHTYHVVCGPCTMLPCASLAWLCFAVLQQQTHVCCLMIAVSLMIVALNSMQWAWQTFIRAGHGAAICLVAWLLHMCVHYSALHCITVLGILYRHNLYRYHLHSDRPVPTPG